MEQEDTKIRSFSFKATKGQARGSQGINVFLVKGSEGEFFARFACKELPFTPQKTYFTSAARAATMSSLACASCSFSWSTEMALRTLRGAMACATGSMSGS